LVHSWDTVPRADRDGLPIPVRRIIDQQRKPYVDPQRVEQAKAAEARVAAAPKTEGTSVQTAEAQRHLDAANNMLVQHVDAGRLTPEDVAAVKGGDINSRTETLGKAYRAAAACLASGIYRITSHGWCLGRPPTGCE
jgi:hypothetical protein